MIKECVVLGAAALAVLPTLSKDRKPAVQRVRGSAQRMVQDLKARPVDVAKAAATFEGRKRLAVLPFGGADKGLRSAIEDAIAADLQYVPAYLVADKSEVSGALGPIAGSMDDNAAAEIGRKLDAKLVLTGTVESAGDELKLTVRLLDLSGDVAKFIAGATANREKADVFALCDSALVELLTKTRTLPDDKRLAEMKKVPTRNLKALTECSAGLALLEQAAGLLRGERPDLSEQALKHAEAALAADAEFLQAYILKTSCLWNLDRKTELKTTLGQARVKINAERTDELTRLELEGDFLLFARGDFEQAAAKYRRMLEIDPAHLRGLWTLVAVYSGDYGAEGTYDDDETAAELAARLVLAHPKSPVAAFFTGAETKVGSE